VSRIRTVKPEFFRDPKVSRVSRDARLLMIGMLTEADDEGRLLAAPKLLAGSLYPHDPDVTATKVARWEKELADAHLIRFYDADGIRYVHIPTFLRHQRVNRPTPSRLPQPPTHEGLTESLSESVTEPSPPEVEVELGTRNREQGTRNMSAAKPRARDVLFEALCEATNIDWRELTESERGAANKALAQLRQVDATPDEVLRRAENYPTHFSDAALTPTALARHWSLIGSPGKAGMSRLGPLDRLAMQIRGGANGQVQSDSTGEPSRRSLPR
jgi:hypothetical protein